MRVISVHSHKGGAGKTTLTLMIAKAQAMTSRKVCAVDLDFIGSGFEHLLDVHSPKRFLEEYITKDPGSPNLPKIKEMITSYSDKDLGKNSLDLVFNSAGSMINNNEKDRWKSHTLLGMEPAQSIAARSVMRFLSILQEEGYETVILDCHPGLAYLSMSLLHHGQKSPFEEHVFVFVSTINRAHFYGLINELNALAAEEFGKLFNPSQSIICLNRAIPKEYGSWKGLKDQVRQKEKVHKGEALTRMGTFEDVCREGDGMNYMCITDSETVSQWGKIGGRGEIILPGKGEIRFTNTPLCLRVLEGL